MDLLPIEGIETAYMEQLAVCSVTRPDELLRRAATRLGRDELSQLSGISAHHLLRWVNLADLCRVRGLRPEHARLLAAAGITSLAQLSRCDPLRLQERLFEEARRQWQPAAVPPMYVLEEWIAEASCLPRLVEL